MRERIWTILCRFSEFERNTISISQISERVHPYRYYGTEIGPAFLRLRTKKSERNADFSSGVTDAG